MADKPVGRQQVRGDGRKKRQHKRATATFEFRNDVVGYFRDLGSVQDTLDRFFLGLGLEGAPRESKRKQIYYWVRNHAYINECASSTTLSQQRRVCPSGLGTTLSPEAEQVIVQWISNLRREGVPVAASMLQLKARETADEHGFPSRAFSGCWEWWRGFLKHQALSFRAQTHTGQQTPVDAIEAARRFAASVRAKIEIEGITSVFNADQAGVFFEYLPRRTVNKSDATTVLVKCRKKQKERVTAMVLGDAHGAKYPLFIILRSIIAKIAEMRAENERLHHGFGKRLWKDISLLQDRHNIQIYGNSSAWWNGFMTIEFLRFHFGERTPFSASILLLLDDFSGHWVAAVVEYARSLSIVLMKPADVAWMKPQKDRLRKHWVDYLYDQLQSHRRSATTSEFQLSPPTRENAVDWVSSAWNDLAPSTIIAGFRRCVFGSASVEDVKNADDLATQHKTNELVDRFREMLLLDSHIGDVTASKNLLSE